MITVQRVAAAAEIIIVSIRCEHIVDFVIKSLKTEHRTFLISLGRMIKYHVEDHFDAIFMKILDQFLELPSLMIPAVPGGIAGVRGKKTYRIISPVVEQLLAVHLAGVCQLIKLKDRHELHGIDPQLF